MLDANLIFFFVFIYNQISDWYLNYRDRSISIECILFKVLLVRYVQREKKHSFYTDDGGSYFTWESPKRGVFPYYNTTTWGAHINIHYTYINSNRKKIITQCGYGRSEIFKNFCLNLLVCELKGLEENTHFNRL